MAEFDKVVHVRNGKGEITRENHYILRVANGEARFERPPKSGIWYSGDGKLINAEKSIDSMADSLVPKEATPITGAGQTFASNAKSK